MANVNSNVYALDVGGSQLFVAGSFSSIRSVSRSRVASLNLSDGTVTPFAPVANATVSSLAVDATGSRYLKGIHAIRRLAHHLGRLL